MVWHFNVLAGVEAIDARVNILLLCEADQTRPNHGQRLITIMQCVCELDDIAHPTPNFICIIACVRPQCYTSNESHRIQPMHLLFTHARKINWIKKVGTSPVSLELLIQCDKNTLQRTQERIKKKIQFNFKTICSFVAEHGRLSNPFTMLGVIFVNCAGKWRIIVAIQLTISTEAFISLVRESVVHCILFELVAIRLQIGFYRLIADANLWMKKNHSKCMKSSVD